MVIRAEELGCLLPRHFNIDLDATSALLSSCFLISKVLDDVAFVSFFLLPRCFVLQKSWGHFVFLVLPEKREPEHKLCVGL